MRPASKYLITIHDLAVVPIAWLGAFWLRFNLGMIPDEYLSIAMQILPVLWLIQFGAFVYFKHYRGLWRYASVSDLIRIIKAVVSAALITLLIVFLVWRLEAVPRSVFPLYALLLVGLLAMPRLLVRWYGENKTWLRDTGRRVLIIGAGKAGEMLLRDLLREGGKDYYPVGIVDDDVRKQKKEIHGIRVIGTIDDIAMIAQSEHIELAILAIPSANTREMRRIIEICENASLSVRTLPRLQDIVSGDATVSTLKQVSIEDLLGRDPVQLDWSAINRQIAGKTIAVTGGGGSIGSELCRQIAKMGPSCLIVVDNGEFNLYRIDFELRKSFPGLEIQSILLDVTNASAVSELFDIQRPDVVFHAAAYKHVPLLEKQALVAVNNNVLGTKTVADAAVRTGTSVFVLVSTDKAVNPTNVMGTTKRMAELYCQSLNDGSGTHFITVRFGNVLGSAGSVIPLFSEQIAAGGPVTVTHKDITRYFMTIPEASQLIMQASVLGKGGEIFVLDMGEPIKIAYLAEQMIILSGKKPVEDIEIIYTGLRPGEKLYEELFYDGEGHQRTAHNKIFRADTSRQDKEKIERAVEEIQSCLAKRDETALIGMLRKIVPENRIGKSDTSSSGAHEKILKFPVKE
jgi:FlaA1/EpsC-like NDP-sugar epimerase